MDVVNRPEPVDDKSPFQHLAEGKTLYISASKYFKLVTFEMEVWEAKEGGYMAETLVHTPTRFFDNWASPPRPIAAADLLRIVTRYGYEVDDEQ